MKLELEETGADRIEINQSRIDKSANIGRTSGTTRSEKDSKEGRLGAWKIKPKYVHSVPKIKY